jgi:hypothetical protein
MKHYLSALVLVAGFAAAQANAGCDYPSKPGKLPDGTSATKEEMLAAKKLVVDYTESMKSYLECLDAETTAKLAAMPTALEKDKAEYQSKQDQKHNAAVTEMTEVTDNFNVQLRAYKAKNPPKTS